MNSSLISITSRAATVALASAAFSTIGAQTPAARFVDSARVEIDRASATMDTARLGRTMILLDRALVAFPDDPYLLHYRGYISYLQVVGAMMNGNIDSAQPIITRGLADLQTSAAKLAWPETLALEASLNGMNIALDRSLGMTLGPLSGRLSEEAEQMGPDNPRVALLQAYSAEMTPKSMGGGAARAKELAAKAVELFATDHPSPLAPAWGKEEARALLERLSK